MLEPRHVEILKKLDRELVVKRRYDEMNRERNANIAERTGIPIELAGNQAVTYGLMLGLIQNKTSLNGTEKRRPSVFDMIGNALGGGGSVVDYTSVDGNFDPLDDEYLSDRTAYHQRRVMTEGEWFDKIRVQWLHDIVRRLSDVIVIDVDWNSSDPVGQFIKNAADVVALLHDEDEKDEEVQVQLAALREATLIFDGVCSANRKSLVEAKTTTTTMNVFDQMFHLVDSYRPCAYKRAILQREMVVRHYTRDPSVRPFDMETILADVCVPSILELDINELVWYAIVSPYGTSPVGYLQCTDDYYLLIKDDGKFRYWQVDHKLQKFSTYLCRYIRDYLKRTIDRVRKSTHLLESNLEKVSKLNAFIRQNIRLSCPIVADGYDVFRHLHTAPVARRVRSVAATDRKKPAIIGRNV